MIRIATFGYFVRSFSVYFTITGNLVKRISSILRLEHRASLCDATKLSTGGREKLFEQRNIYLQERLCELSPRRRDRKRIERRRKEKGRQVDGKNVGRCNFQSVEMEKVQCRVLSPVSNFPSQFFPLAHLFIYSRVNVGFVSSFCFCARPGQAGFSNFHCHLFVIRTNSLCQPRCVAPRAPRNCVQPSFRHN